MTAKGKILRSDRALQDMGGGVGRSRKRTLTKTKNNYSRKCRAPRQCWCRGIRAHGICQSCTAGYRKS